MPRASVSSASSSSPEDSHHHQFSRVKTVLALSVVVGCFAILWPKIFYPMLVSSLPGSNTGSGANNGGGGGDVCCDVINEKDVHAYKFMNELCTKVVEQQSRKWQAMVNENQTITISLPSDPKLPKWRKALSPEELPRNLKCRYEIMLTCDMDVDVLLKEHSVISKEYKEALAKLRSYNVSKCLRDNYEDVQLEIIGMQKLSKNVEPAPSYMRQERSMHGDNFVHPALRERGSAIPKSLNQQPGPRRTLDVEARPGPKPGIRPPMGHGAHYSPQPTRGPGGGTMGIIMPLYTIGIVVFFLYTIFKILFRNREEKDSAAAKNLGREQRSYSTSSGGSSSGYGSGGYYNSSSHYNSQDEYVPRQHETTNNCQTSNHENHSRAHASGCDGGVGRRASIENYYGGRRRSSAGIVPGPTIPIIQDISKPRQMAPIARKQKSICDIYECGTATEPQPATRKTTDKLNSLDNKVVELEQELDTGEREHDAIVTAVKGIIAEIDRSHRQPSKVPTDKKDDTDMLEESQEDVSPTSTTTTKAKPPISLKLSKDEAANKENEEPSPDTQKKFLQLTNSGAFMRFVQDLSELVVKQSIETASAAIAFEQQGKSSKKATSPANLAPSDKVSVVGMIERAGLENGEKWTDRSSTPTFRQSSVSPLPRSSSSPRVLTPPISESIENIPNIYLEGPIPPESDQFMVADSRSEEVLDEDIDFDEDDEDYDTENDKPVVLSGKVTLSMFSSAGGTAGSTTTHQSVSGVSGLGAGAGAIGFDEITEAPSLSGDEYARATKDPRLATTGKVQDLTDALASAINDENGARSAQGFNTKASSPDMDEYELIGKGSNGDDDDDDDADPTQYTTAEAGAVACLPGTAGEETAADISAIDGEDGRGGAAGGSRDNDDLLDDEEVEEEEYEEEEELDDDADEEEEEESDDEPPRPPTPPRQTRKQVPDRSKGGLSVSTRTTYTSDSSGPTSPTTSTISSASSRSSRSRGSPSPYCGTYFSEP